MWMWMNREEYTGPSLESLYRKKQLPFKARKHIIHIMYVASIAMHAHSTCMYAVSPPTHFRTRDGLLCIMNKFRMANALRL